MKLKGHPAWALAFNLGLALPAALAASTGLAQTMPGAASAALASPQTGATPLTLAKVFKAIKDARREGQVFRTGATATAERAILGGQVGLGAVAIAAGCEHLSKNPAATPFVTAVAAIAARVAERIRTLVSVVPGGISTSPTDEPLELPTPPVDANLTAAEGVLMAGVIGEIRVVISALTVLERLGIQPMKRRIEEWMRPRIEGKRVH